MAGMTVGMGHRRQRLHPDAFLAHEIALPPIAEQERIVVAVGAADAAIAAADDEHDAALTALRALREHTLEELDTHRLGDLLVSIEAGKSTKAADHAPLDGEAGVLKVSAIRAGQFRPSEAKAVEEPVQFPEKARVRDGDLLISRANTRLLVGAACRVRGTFPNLFLCDKTLRLVPKPDLDPDFLVHALAASSTRAQIEDAATGTSDSMKNISQSVIRDLEIPFTRDLAKQQAIARQLDGLQQTGDAAALVRDNTATLRDALAEALLSGNRSLCEPLAA
jgi:type I restriction enzyme S subunit